jgi:hypothetical protein
MDKETQKLINHIETTNNVEKLEVTISMLMFGWVMDDNNKEDYEELIELSQSRLNVLMLLRGEEHPLQHLDLKKDKKKIEMSVMMSMMKSVIDQEEQKFDPFSTMSMN